MNEQERWRGGREGEIEKGGGVRKKKSKTAVAERWLMDEKMIKG